MCLTRFCHLIEHEVRGEPVHDLQHIAEAWADFQVTRLDSGDCLAYQHLHVHPFLTSHFLGELAAEEGGLDSSRSELDHTGACVVQLSAQRLRE